MPLGAGLGTEALAQEHERRPERDCRLRRRRAEANPLDDPTLAPTCVLSENAQVTADASSRSRRLSAVLREEETRPPARALLRSRLRARLHAVHRADGGRPDLGGARAGAARARPALVGLGRLRVADERRSTRRKASSRLAIFVSMAALLVVALCVPEAFDDSALALRGRLRDRPVHAPGAVRAREPRRRRASGIRSNGLGVSTALGVAIAARGGLVRRSAPGDALGPGAPARLWRAVSLRRGRVEARPGTLRRAARTDLHHRARRVDRRARGRRGARCRCRDRRHRRRRDGSGGSALVALLRRRRNRCREETRRRRRGSGAERARRATPIPSCTYRWSPA